MSTHDEPLSVNEECSVCRSPLLLEACGKLPCSHDLHVDCMHALRSFGLTSDVCPTCRAGPPDGWDGAHDEATRRFLVVERACARGDSSWEGLTAAEAAEVEAARAGWLAAARQGNHPFAQNSLGLLYVLGRGGGAAAPPMA